MPKIFPVAPILRPPDWIEPIDLTGDVPSQNQTLNNGIISRLRISEVPNSAEFKIKWHDCASDAVVLAFDNFYNQVGKWDSFTLPIEFWNPNYLIARRNMIIASSPTGYWMFKEKKVVPINTSEWSIEATLVAVIN